MRRETHCQCSWSMWVGWCVLCVYRISVPKSENARKFMQCYDYCYLIACRLMKLNEMAKRKWFCKMRNEFDERSSGNTVPANIYVMSVWVSKKKLWNFSHQKIGRIWFIHQWADGVSGKKAAILLIQPQWQFTHSPFHGHGQMSTVAKNDSY